MVEGEIDTNQELKKSEELAALQREYVPQAVYNVTSIYVQSCQNSFVKDLEGRNYIDFASGIACINTGHRNPEVIQAIREQVDKYLHVCFHVTPYEPYIRLAQKLSNMAPGNFKKNAFFVNSGAEAVENAVKIARYSGKPTVICFENAFHGRTNFCMSITGSVHPYKYRFTTRDPSIHRIPYAYCYRCSFKLEYPTCNMHCVEYIRNTLDVHLSPDETSSIIVEPIQGEGGFIVPPKEFIQGLRNVCDDYGILLIADEVQSGIGRTGKMFAIEHYNVVPDIITLAKALGGGLPLGGVIGRRDLMNNIHVGGLGGTFGGNPLSCVAALKSLEIIERDLINRVDSLSKYLMQRLNEIADKYDVIGDVRGIGLMVGVELVEDKKTKKPAKQARNQILSDCHKNGLLIIGAGSYKNVIRFLPPLSISEALLKNGLDIFEDSIKKLPTG